MTSYNGTAITYDGVGNPLSYRNGMSFTWQAGRQMKSATASGVTTTYKYNQDGLRTSKTVGGSETKYYLNNGVMIAEQNTGAGRAIAYLMDENNNKSGFIYNGAYYYYVFNVQGDVMGIINNSGTMMAKYTYDAWGKVLSVTDGNGVVQSSSSFIGNVNPIRYRGYYYDTETGLYYLQSRYYDPETGRFVNSDGYVQTGTGSVFDKNMYAYCENDPVNFSDPTGKSYMSDCHYYYDESAPYNIPVPTPAPAKNESPFKNKDNSRSLYDNNRNTSGGVFHEQILSAKFTGPTGNISHGQLGAGSLDIILITGGWEFNHFDLSLLDFGKASLYGGKGEGYIGVGAMASIWSPEVTFTVFSWDVKLGADIGSVGVEAGVRDGKFKGGFSNGVGFHFSVGPSY